MNAPAGTSPRSATTLDALWRAVAARRDGALMRQDGAVLSAESFGARVAELRAELLACGVGGGRRVALLLENGAPFLAAHAAALSLGAIVAPLGASLRERGLSDALDVSRAGVLVTSEALVDGLPAAWRGATLIVDGGVGTGSWSAHRRGATARGAPAAPRTPRADDPALLHLTSGTSGRPKAVLATHAQALFAIDAWIDCWGFSPRTVSLMAAPFSHVVFGPLVLGALRAGGTVAISRHGHGRAAAREAERARATSLMGTPFVFAQLLADRGASGRDLSSLDTLIYGAAPSTAAQVRAIATRFPRARLYHCYGLTETCSAVSCLVDADREGRETSVGRPHRGIEVSIRDARGAVLAAGASGEIWVRGPNVVGARDGDAADATAGLREGWLPTGDGGHLDAEGFLHLEGRLDDRIDVAGEKLYPAAIEAVLLQAPGVADAAVAGIPDEHKGQSVRAWVVAHAPGGFDAAALRRHCAAHLPPGFVPREIVAVPALPRNALGKLERRRLG